MHDPGLCRDNRRDYVSGPATDEQVGLLQKYTVTEDTNGGYFTDNLRSSAVLDGSNFTNEKLKPEDNGQPPFAPPPRSPGHALPPKDDGGGKLCARNIRTREVILIVIGCVLLIGAAVGTAVAIILSQADSSSSSTSTTSSPSTSSSLTTPAHISYDGSLTLQHGWKGTEKELNTNFSSEMDIIIEDTPLEESYTGSNVRGYSEETSKLAFTLFFTSGLLDFEVPTPSPGVTDRHGYFIENQLRDSVASKHSSLGIDSKTIEIIEHIPTSSLSSTTASSTSDTTSSSISASTSTSSSSSSAAPSTSTPSTTAYPSSAVTTQTTTTLKSTTTTVPLPPTQCFPLAFELCRSVGYNITYLPNMWGSNTEDQAISHFYQIVNNTLQSECSPLTLFYFCGLFFPECNIYHQFIYPCVEVCEAVNRNCIEENTLRINCSFFNTSNPCLSPPSSLTTTAAPVTTTRPDSCTALTLDTCRNVGYNRIFLPNIMLHSSMGDAVNGFNMLPETIVSSNCSHLVTFYLCGLYFPECSEDGEPLYPCKSVCEELAATCGSSVTMFGCDFHDRYDNCIAAPTTTPTPSTTTTITTTTTAATTTTPDKCIVFEEELCNRIGFNRTLLPNVFRIGTIDVAKGYFAQFPKSIVQAECSPLTEFYVCGLIFPKCGDDGQMLQPCRNVCQAIRRDCTTSVSMFDCEGQMFSDTNCLKPPPELLTTTTTSATTTSTTTTTTTVHPAVCTNMAPFTKCADLGYNTTIFPNLFGDRAMDTAVANFDYFAGPSLQNNCSSIGLDFFCALLFPRCEETPGFKGMQPCKDFCDAVVESCASYLPFPFDCNFLPTDPKKCIGAPYTPPTRGPPICVNQTFGYCREEGFTNTRLPNWFSETASGSVVAFNQYGKSTIESGCSYMAKFFYCGIFFPQCEEDGNVTLPCRSVCDEMTAKCGSVWSFPMDCRVFPNDTEKCLHPPAPPTTTTAVAPSTTQPLAGCRRMTVDLCKVFGYNVTYLPDGWAYTSLEEAFKAYETYGERGVALGCSQKAMFYFCSVLFPPCVNGKKQKPCRDVCQDINDNCLWTKDLFRQDCDILSDPNESTCIRPEPKTPCRSDEFSCFGTNKCVPKYSVCNRNNDCGDWSDEKNCPACNEFQYRCEMGFCIKSYQRCNGVVDCPDRSDEINCTCSNGQYPCTDGTCIMSEWVCDGENDCSNGKDEADCGACRRSEFACRSGECLPLDQHCDGTPQCVDHSDESQCIFAPEEKRPFSLRFEQEGLIPVCASNFNASLADLACRKLGHTGHQEWRTVRHVVFAYAVIDGVGPETTVIGRATIRGSCPGSSAVVLKCHPKECGHPKPHRVSYIVNGNNAIDGEWPWQASIQRKGKHFCGGALVSPNFIVTAAHCVEAYTSDHRNIEVVLGASNVSAKEPQQQRYKVKSLTIHNHIYHQKNDIALVQIDGTVNYTDYIRPICLPGKDDVFTKTTKCYAAGWGMTKADGPASQWLKDAKMRLWNTAKCNGSYAWNGAISETHLCAGYYSGLISICVGDSGGPLMCQTNDNNWKLVGVASYVARGCNVPARPSVFSDVNVFKEWIEDKIECKFRCKNGNCIFDREKLCDRKNDCGDNSDEIELCNTSVNCTFDDKFLCGYNGSWHLRTQSDYDNRYPLYDHTHGAYPGMFMIAKSRGKALASPRFTINTTHCASFYYHMRGPVTGGLQVWTHRLPEQGQNDWLPVFRRNQYMGEDNWVRGEFTITPESYEIVFFSDEQGRIAVDDFMLAPGACANSGCPDDMVACTSGLTLQCIKKSMQCNMVADCEKGEDESSCTAPSLSCDFESGLECGLRQATDDDTHAEWRMMNASSSDRKVTDNTFRNESGVMLLLDTNYLLEDKEVKMHQNLILNQPNSCLKFSYYSNSPGSMQITYTRNGSGVANLLWSIKNRRTLGWAKTQVDIPVSGSIKLEYTVIGGVYDLTYKPFIAIDDIHITEGSCGLFDCEPDLMPCTSENYCLPMTSFCDRRVDCNDASDEAGCTCTPEEFKCPDGPCIPMEKTCDRHKDCLDDTDEAEICAHLVSVSCDFENHFLCGYTFNDTAYKWAQHAGETITPSTGPKSDHTYGNKTGHYIYADGTDGVTNAITTLESPSFASTGNGVVFYYQIYSAFQQYPQFQKMHLGNLTVKVRDNTDGAVTVVFQDKADGNQRWKHHCVDLPVSQNLTLVFIAQRGNRTQADVALDDVKLLSSSCIEEIRNPHSTTATTAAPANGCPEGKRMCQNGMCAPQEYFCDGYPYDCVDNSDELNC
ncbi:uncharacterized protein [Haliotis asinina]|uniref:uncharacterized protein isoform X1 n=1 Tax=Haliotis asinina TaxID=109174 RepID=UPI003531F76A